MAWLSTILSKSPNPRLRRKAVENLSGSSHPSDTEHMVRALHDASYEVRAAAARALGRNGSPNAAGELAVCLKDPDAEVRVAAAGALRAIGWKATTHEESAWFEITLGYIRGADTASTTPPFASIKESSQETSFHHRQAVAEQKERTNPSRINSLLAALRGDDLLARISAVCDLGQVNDPQITKELLTLFRDPEPEVRLTAVHVLAGREGTPPSHFLGLLQDPNPEVRLAAVQFLGRIHAPQIAQVLRPLLSDPNLPVRQATAVAMRTMGRVSAIEDLVASPAETNRHRRQTVESTQIRSQDENLCPATTNQPVDGQFAVSMTCLSAIDIIQLKCGSNATIVLQVASPSGIGRIYIEDGQIVHAESPDARGEDALEVILRWKGGQIKEMTAVDKPQRTITTDWQGLLMDICQRIDETSGAEGTTCNSKAPAEGPVKVLGPEPAPAKEKADATADDNFVVVSTYDGQWCSSDGLDAGEQLCSINQLDVFTGGKSLGLTGETSRGND